MSLAALVVVTPAARAFTGSPGNKAIALVGSDREGRADVCGTTATAISGDGRYVAFVSTCPKGLTSGPDARQVYERDLQTGTTRLVSVNNTGTGGGNCDSGEESAYRAGGIAVSGDGRYVVFESCATDLTLDAEGASSQVYERDMVAGTTRLISAGQRAAGYTCGSGGPFIGVSSVAVSDDGNYVVFRSCRPEGTVSSGYEVFERNVSAGRTVRVSNAYCSNNVGGLAVSNDGRYVAYGDCGRPPGCPNCSDYTGYVYQRDMQTGAVQTVSIGPSGAGVGTGDNSNSYGNVSMSRDGRYITFGDDYPSRIYLRDTRLHTTYQVGPDSGQGSGVYCFDRTSVSGDGQYVAFSCSKSGTQMQVYRQDMQTGIVRLASANYYGSDSNCASLVPSMSSDGRYVSFTSCATNLTTIPPNGAQQGYVRDMHTPSGNGNGPFAASETYGRFNPAEPACRCSTGWEGDPVNTHTGDYSETVTDASIPGHGASLEETRTYDSLNGGTSGRFGNGWSDSYGAHLRFDAVTGDVTVVQGSGAEAPYVADPATGALFAPPRVTATLVKRDDGTYRFTTLQPGHHLTYSFDTTGRLTAIADANGYVTSVSYPDATHSFVTDPSGRRLVFTSSGGLVTSMTDPMGHTTRYDYDDAKNLTRVTDPLDRITSFTYDADHRLISWTDPRGGRLTNVYDEAGRVTAQIDRAGRRTTFAYGGDEAHTTTITDPLGHVTAERYEDGFLVTKTSEPGLPAQKTWTYEYDPDTGAQTSVTDPNGHRTVTSVDAHGNVLTSTDPSGHTTTSTYDTTDHVTSTTDALGTRTTFTYDSHGNLLSRSTPLSGGRTAVWSYAYGTGTAAEDLTRETNPAGASTTYGYDAAGNRTSMTNALGKTTQATFDPGGHLLSVTTPADHTTHYAYDTAGQLSTVTDPLGVQTSFTYDGNGNSTAVTDGAGHRTTYDYDADDEQTKVTRPDGSTSTTVYDDAGNVSKQTNSNGHSRQYEYDALHHATRTTDLAGNVSTRTYDGVGNVLTVVDGSRRTTTFSYDPDDNVIGVHHSDGTTPDVTETYDANGRRTSLHDGTGTSTFAYDELGQLTHHTDGAGATVGYTHDLTGAVTAITYPSGRTVQRTYDDAGQLGSVTDWQGITTRFRYDDDGHETSSDRADAVTSRSTYDGAGHLTGIIDANGDGPLATFAYSHDAMGRVTRATASGAVTTDQQHDYDENARLTTDGTTRYGYDAADNATTYGAQVQRFDSADRLSSSYARPPDPVANPPLGGGYPGENPGPSAGQESGDEKVPPAPLIEPKPTVKATVSAHKIDTGRTLSARLTTKQSGDLLVAFVSAQGPMRGNQTTSKPKTAGMVWRPVSSSHSPGGLVSIWQAHAPRKLARAQITTQLGRTTTQALMTVVAFGPGARLGSHPTRTGRSGVPQIKLQVPARSQTWLVGHDATGGTARTLVAGGHLVDQAYSRSAHAASWVQSVEAERSGMITIGTRKPSSKSWATAGLVVWQTGSGARSSVRTGRDDSIIATGDVAPTLAGTSSASTWRSFTYDAAGNRTGVSNGETQVRIGYDQDGRITKVGDTSYTYDGDGLRATKTTGEAPANRFAWDKSSSVPMLVQDGDTSYIYGPNGRVIEQITDDTPTFLLTDGQGNTRVIANRAGHSIGTYDYDAWGNVKSHSGASTNLQYRGQYTDAETGYQYLRARYYDPSTGQFLTIDPLAALTRSPYGYAGSDPVNGSDPTGLFDWQHAVGVVAVAVSVVGLAAAGCVIAACIPDAALIAGAATGVSIGLSTYSVAYDCGLGGSGCTRSSAACLAIDVASAPLHGRAALVGGSVGLACGVAGLSIGASGRATTYAPICPGSEDPRGIRLLQQLQYGAREQQWSRR